MRIQHNIMAMNAYRNYTNNVSAMKKNLEKLSSGYKINRAGDDAAGLAISEKMRAQITGLETAQKNAKDGISLVQTAEGALTEVHDMLNRMVTLATQSANGTYDNETDRVQLQKELDQLRSEINRIADSSNFNGIKLLDGTMASGVTAGRDVKFDLPTVGYELGVNTVLHSTPATDKGSSFSVDLHNVGFNSYNGQSMEIQLGDYGSIKIAGKTGNASAAAGDQLDASAIVGELVAGFAAAATASSAAAAKTAFESNGNYTDLQNAELSGDLSFSENGYLLLDGKEFEVTDGGNGRLVFTQVNAPKTEEDVFDGHMEITVKGDTGIAQHGITTVTKGSNATVNGLTVNVSGLDADAIKAAVDELKLTTQSDIEIDTTSGIKLKAGTKVLATATVSGKIGASDVSAIASISSGVTANLTVDFGKFGQITITGSVTAGASASALALNNGIKGGIATGSEFDPDAAAVIDGTADYNKSATVIANVTLDGGNRLASTYFDLTKDMVKDGASIQFGNKTYMFSMDGKATAKNGEIIVDLSKLDSSADDYLSKVAEELTTKAKDNTTGSTYTVGHDGSRITVTEIDGQDHYDLTTLDGIRKSLGYKTADVNGSGLKLQIGDTSDGYNQLTVSIQDMHTDSLGIADIDISTQDGAANAMDKIKAAINMVSDVRGTLGATQNRLDHTINNLSVMQENIQDAESTIRDTDIASEMMAYTKNNILIQSAQAMLAQANQVPQGVLQLLQ